MLAPNVFRAWPKKKIIFLHGKLQDFSAASIKRILEEAPVKKLGEDRLYFIINCKDGGDFPATFLVRNALLKCGMKVVTVVYGEAYSSALTLMQCGAERLMTRGSTLRFHQATITFDKNLALNAEGFLLRVRRLMRIDGEQLKIYGERTGVGQNALEKLLESEAVLDARSAKRLNFADRIIPEPASLRELVRHLLPKTDDAFLKALEELEKYY